MVEWGIIGWGNIARRFAASLKLSAQGRLLAVASKSGAEDEMLCREFADKGISVYRSYEDLLEDQRIQVVYIALPHKYHQGWTIKALNQKKAVLCEKPMGMNRAQLEEMDLCAKENGVFLMEALKTPFIPLVPVLKKALESGVIGQIRSVSASFCSDAVDRLPPQHYMFDQEQGGVLYDVGTYPIAFVRSIANASVTLLDAEMMMKNGVDYAFSANLRFANGIEGIVEGSICHKKDRTANIEGTLGRMEVPVYSRPDRYRIHRPGQEVVETILEIPGDDLLGEIEEVHRCLARGLLESHSYSLMDTHKVLEVMDLIRTFSNRKTLL